MNKSIMMFLLVIAIPIFLAGCNTGDKNKGDLSWTDSFVKAQKIEVISSDNSDVIAILDNRNIEVFIDALKIEEWDLADIPLGATKGNKFKMYQENTVKLFGKVDKSNKKDDLTEIATLTAYKDAPYIKFKFKNLSFDFKIPDYVAEYLNSLRD